MLAAVITPGWLLWGRVGAHLSVALVAALTGALLHRLLHETVPDRRLAGVTWVLAAFLPSFLPMVTHINPNMLGAALIVAAYRYALGDRPAQLHGAASAPSSHHPWVHGSRRGRADDRARGRDAPAIRDCCPNMVRGRMILDRRPEATDG